MQSKNHKVDQKIPMMLIIIGNSIWYHLSERRYDRFGNWDFFSLAYEKIEATLQECIINMATLLKWLIGNFFDIMGLLDRIL